MTKEKLVNLLEPIPDDAIVYIEADHSQTAEQVSNIRVTGDHSLPYYGDDMNWVDIEDIDPKDVIGVLIW